VDRRQLPLARDWMNGIKWSGDMDDQPFVISDSKTNPVEHAADKYDPRIGAITRDQPGDPHMMHLNTNT